MFWSALTNRAKTSENLPRDTCAQPENSNQPVLSRSLIRIFLERIVDRKRCKVSSSGQRTLIRLRGFIVVFVVRICQKVRFINCGSIAIIFVKIWSYPCHAEWIKMPRPLLISSQSDYISGFLIEIRIFNDKQCRFRSVGFFRSQLIWIYTVC